MATQEIYYIPEGSKWPIVGTLSLFVTFLGGAMMFNSVDAGKYVLIIGLALLTYMFAGWFADVIAESIAGKYSKQVDVSFRMGMGGLFYLKLCFLQRSLAHFIMHECFRFHG